MINKWRVSLIVVPLIALVLGGVPVSAQDAGGIAQCLVGCANRISPAKTAAFQRQLLARTHVWHTAAARQEILISLYI